MVSIESGLPPASIAAPMKSLHSLGAGVGTASPSGKQESKSMSAAERAGIPTARIRMRGARMSTSVRRDRATAASGTRRDVPFRFPSIGPHEPYF